MSAGDFAFRPIGPGDADALARCFERNAVPEVTDTFDPFPLDAATAHRIAAEPRRDRYYAAVSADGTILGMSMLRGWDEGYEVPSFGVFVDREHQGRGIGGGLLDRTLEEAWAAGAPSVRLTVYTRNAGAERLYRSRGFEVAEERPGKVVMVLAR
jgi:GNAT superfamily N-acetyltransferase